MDSDTEYPKVCCFCKESFNSEESYALHLDRHRNLTGKLYKCSQCNKYATTLASLKQHEATHDIVDTLKSKFRCLECKISFKSLNEKARHRRREHYTAKKVHTCECSSQLFTRAELVRHKRNFHGQQEKKYKQDDVRDTINTIEVQQASASARRIVFGSKTVEIGDPDLGRQKFANFKIKIDLYRRFHIDEEGHGISLHDILQYGMPNEPASCTVIRLLIDYSIKHSPHFFQIREVFYKTEFNHVEEYVYEADKIDNETDEEDFEEENDDISEFGNMVQESCETNSTDKYDEEANVEEAEDLSKLKREIASIYVPLSVKLTSAPGVTQLCKFPHNYYSSDEFVATRNSLNNKIVISMQYFPFHTVDEERTCEARSNMNKDRKKKGSLYMTYYIGHFVLFIFSARESLLWIFDSNDDKLPRRIENMYKKQAEKWLQVLGLNQNAQVKIVNLNFQAVKGVELECATFIVRIVDCIVTEYNRRLDLNPGTLIPTGWMEEFVRENASMDEFQMRKFKERQIVTILKNVEEYKVLLQTPTTKYGKEVSNKVPALVSNEKARPRHNCAFCVPGMSYINKEEYKRHMVEDIHLNNGLWNCKTCNGSFKRNPHAHFKKCTTGPHQE